MNRRTLLARAFLAASAAFLSPISVTRAPGVVEPAAEWMTRVRAVACGGDPPLAGVAPERIAYYFTGAGTHHVVFDTPLEQGIQTEPGDRIQVHSPAGLGEFLITSQEVVRRSPDGLQ